MPSRSLLSVQEKLERRWRYVQEAEWVELNAALQGYYHVLDHERALQPTTAHLRAMLPETRRQLDEYFHRGTTPEFGPGDEPPVASADTQRSAARDFQSEYAAWGLVLLGAIDALLNEQTEEGRRQARSIEPRLRHLMRTPLNTSKSNDAVAIEARDARAFQALINGRLRSLHEYLLDALDSNVETLAAIRWFQHWSQWFGASRFAWERYLEDKAVDAGAKKNHDYERRFQLVLFEKLFEYGLHLDISREPNTAAGSPDFTVNQRTSTGPRPIVVEAKILDKETDSKAKLGHLQIRRYMDTFHADTGYLVLFDLTERGHHVELPDRLDDLPFLPIRDGRQVFVIHAPCVPQVSASKANPVALKTEHFKYVLN